MVKYDSKRKCAALVPATDLYQLYRGLFNSNLSLSMY